MITIIHGDDIVSSRKLLVDLRSKNKDSFTFEGDKLKIDDLVQIFEGENLFGNDKTVFIENFLSKKTEKESEDLKNYIKNNSSMEIYLWEGKEIGKSTIASFGKADSKLFKIPKNIFAFLDSIKPDNGKTLVLEFHKNIETTDAEFIFQMIVRQFRLLLTISEEGKEQIDEALRLQDWQKRKLKNQASYFSINKLKELYKKLYEIDLGIKTGSLNMTLVQAIDMFLLDV